MAMVCFRPVRRATYVTHARSTARKPTAKQQTKTVVKKTVRLDRVRGTPKGADKAPAGSRLYFNVTGFPFPLGPFVERKTVRYEVRLTASLPDCPLSAGQLSSAHRKGRQWFDLNLVAPR